MLPRLYLLLAKYDGGDIREVMEKNLSKEGMHARLFRIIKLVQASFHSLVSAMSTYI